MPASAIRQFAMRTEKQRRRISLEVHNEWTIAIGIDDLIAGLSEGNFYGPQPWIVGSHSHRRSPKLDNRQRDVAPRVPLGIRKHRAEIRSDYKISRSGNGIGEFRNGRRFRTRRATALNFGHRSGGGPATEGVHTEA